MSYRELQSLIHAADQLSRFDSAIAATTRNVSINLSWISPGGSQVNATVSEFLTMEIEARLQQLLEAARTAYLRKLKQDSKAADAQLDQLKNLIKE